MALAQFGDPFDGVVVWGSAGLVAWLILTAFVGSVLGILREGRIGNGAGAGKHSSPRRGPFREQLPRTVPPVLEPSR